MGGTAGDQVLKSLADYICTEIQNTEQQDPGCPEAVNHLLQSRAEGKTPVQLPSGGLLATAWDWQFQVDLERQLMFPVNIATSSLGPDVVLTLVHQASGATGTDCPVGGPNRRGKRVQYAGLIRPNTPSSPLSARRMAGKPAVSQLKSGAEDSLDTRSTVCLNSLE